MNVIVFPRYDSLGASSRVRFFNYFPYLKKQNTSLQVYPLFDDAYIRYIYGDSNSKSWLLKLFKSYLKRLFILLTAPKNSVIWLEKEFFPYCPALCEIFFFNKFQVILDLDDAWHLRYQNHFALKSKMRLITSKAYHVIVANPPLEEWVLKQGRTNVTLIPTCISIHEKLSSKKQNKEVLIGWIGTPETEKYLTIVRDPLEKLAQEYSIRLVIMGGKQFPPIPNLKIDFLDWSIKKEEKFLSTIDIGIMPLHNAEWEKYKSGYKLLQYMSYERPVVGSPIGVNDRIIQHKVNGYKATEEEEWYHTLKTLLASKKLRTVMGKKGLDFVKKNYNLLIYSKILFKILQNSDQRKNLV